MSLHGPGSKPFPWRTDSARNAHENDGLFKQAQERHSAFGTQSPRPEPFGDTRGLCHDASEYASPYGSKSAISSIELGRCATQPALRTPRHRPSRTNLNARANSQPSTAQRRNAWLRHGRPPRGRLESISTDSPTEPIPRASGSAVGWREVRLRKHNTVLLRPFGPQKYSSTKARTRLRSRPNDVVFRGSSSRSPPTG